jgi:hypothetical protein
MAYEDTGGEEDALLRPPLRTYTSDSNDDILPLTSFVEPATVLLDTDEGPTKLVAGEHSLRILRSANLSLKRWLKKIKTPTLSVEKNR